MKRTQAIVIGAGIIGCATAFELAKKGYHVISVDKNSGAGFGSTANSCGIIRTFYSTRPGITLAYEGSFYFENWAEYVEHKDEHIAEFTHCGVIQLMSADNHHKKVLPIHQELGIPHEVWSLDELKRRQPYFDPGSYWPPSLPDDSEEWHKPKGQIIGAMCDAVGGYVSDTVLATHNLQKAAEAYGAEFVFGRAVAAIRQNGEQVLGVTLDNGEEIGTPVVVNVGGPHSFILNRLAGVDEKMKIKTRALRHEVHFVLPPEGVDFVKMGCPTSDGDNGVYFRPEVGNMILVGSEDPECDGKDWIDDPDHFSREVTDFRWKAQTSRLGRRIPELRLPNEKKGLVELYDASDDWIPIYDKSDLTGYYMAIGTSGNQFKNAGVVGHLMSELIDRCEHGHDHDKEPITLIGKYSGLPIEVGFFSRNREIRADSSFSVLG